MNLLLLLLCDIGEKLIEAVFLQVNDYFVAVEINFRTFMKCTICDNNKTTTITIATTITLN